MKCLWCFWLIFSVDAIFLDSIPKRIIKVIMNGLNSKTFMHLFTCHQLCIFFYPLLFLIVTNDIPNSLPLLMTQLLTLILILFVKFNKIKLATNIENEFVGNASKTKLRSIYYLKESILPYIMAGANL